MHSAMCRLGKLVVAAVFTITSSLSLAGGLPGNAPPGPPAQPPPPPCDGPCCKPGPDDSDGDPVFVWTGAQRLSETDLVTHSAFPITLERNYDSASTLDTSLGYGWAFRHDRSIYEYPDNSVLLRTECGNRARFLPVQGGGYSNDGYGPRGVLTRSSDGSFEFRYNNGTRDRFDADGRLVEEVSPEGRRHQFSYDAAGKLPLKGVAPRTLDNANSRTVANLARVTRIRELTRNGVDTGIYVDLTYDANGRVQQARTNDGRTVTYEHDVFGSTGTRGNLTRVNGLAGVPHIYQYNDPVDPHLITSMQKGSRAGVQPVLNVYMASPYPTKPWRRIQTQTWGNDVLTFTYGVATGGADSLQRTVTRTVYDHQGQALHIVTRNFQHASNGLVTSRTEPEGVEIRSIYDPITNRKTREETWAPESPGQPVTLARATNFTYNAEGRVTSSSITLDSGETITRSHEFNNGRMTAEQVVSSLNPTAIFRTEYDYNLVNGAPITLAAVRRLLSAGSAIVTQFQFDAQDRMLKTILPDGVEIRLTYDGTRQLPATQTFYQNNIAILELAESMTYDAAGRISTRTVADKATTSFTYDARSRILTQTNALGETTAFTYTDDLPNTVERGRTVADGEGQITRSIHDGRDRLIRVERKNDGGSFATFVTFDYDSVGRRLRSTDALGRATRYTYDRAGQLVAITDALQRTTGFGFDLLGRRIETTDPLQRKTIYRYDDQDRLIATEQQGINPAATTSFTYDAQGNLLTVTDPESNTTSYTYDRLSRRTRETKPLGQFVSYDYDVRDRLIAQTNARGQVLRFEHAPWGQLTSQKHFANATSIEPIREIGYGYDRRGNLIYTTDNTVIDGHVWDAEYDLLNRETAFHAKYIPLPGGVSSTIAYDRFGNIRARGVVENGVLVQSTSYTYDKRNRLAAAMFAPAQSLTLTHDEADQRTLATYPNGVSETIAFLADGAIDFIDLKRGATRLELWDYAYDANRNVDNISTTQGLFDYAYDGLDRLTLATYPAVTGLSPDAYRYDKVGNREDPTDAARYQYNANNEMTVGLATNAFDADGSLVSVTSVASDYPFLQRTLEYDVGSRVKRIRTSPRPKNSTTSEVLEKAPSPNNDLISTFTYEPLGRRIRTGTSPFLQTSTNYNYYLWSGDQIVADYRADPAIGSSIQRYANLPGDYAPRRLSDSNGSYWVHSDHLSTPRRATNSTGALVWRGDFNAFGRESVNQDVDGNGNRVTINQRFPGQYADASGYHYNVLRDYDSITGRYTQRDPIGLDADINTYVYAGDNPLSYIDPNGASAVVMPRPWIIVRPQPRPIRYPMDPVLPLPYPADPALPKTDDCKAQEMQECERRCWPYGAAGCYVTLKWKLRGAPGGNPIREEVRNVECRCDDDEFISCT